MICYQEVENALFVFINLFSLVNYTILGESLTYTCEKFPKNSVLSTKNINILYFCLIVFVGIRIFALFVTRNLNDWLLHRSLNNGGTYTKLRVLSILILVEVVFFYLYLYFYIFPTSIYYNSEFSNIIVMLVLSFIFNLLNLLIIYFIHPDLLGIIERQNLNKYCNRMEIDTNENFIDV